MNPKPTKEELTQCIGALALVLMLAPEMAQKDRRLIEALRDLCQWSLNYYDVLESTTGTMDYLSAEGIQRLVRERMS